MINYRRLILYGVPLKKFNVFCDEGLCVRFIGQEHCDEGLDWLRILCNFLRSDDSTIIECYWCTLSQDFEVNFRVAAEFCGFLR